MPDDQTNRVALIEAARAATALLTDELPAEDADVLWTEFQARLQGEFSQSALGQLVARLGLSTIEQKIVAALVAFQLETQLHLAVPGSGARGPTTGLVVERLCRTADERLTARALLRPDGKLLRHYVVSVGGSAELELMERPLRLAPAIRNYLMADGTLSERVASVARFIDSPYELLDVIIDPDYRDQARDIAVAHHEVRQKLAAWGAMKICPYGMGVTFLLSGPSGTGKTLFARALATHMDVPLLAVSCADLPERDAESLLRDVFAEARMRRAVVLFDECEALFAEDSRNKSAGLNALDLHADGVTILVSSRPERLTAALERRILLHVPFEHPSADHRRQIWEVHLPPALPLADDVDLDLLADRFELTGGQIRNALQMALTRAFARSEDDDPPLTMALLEFGCRTQLRSSLEDFTTRARTSLRMEDIVLPPRQREHVESLVAAIGNHGLVMNTWGMRERLATGTGIVALFDGPPGTGKTLCAEIIAGEVDQPLHRVNLPQVVSKWVGETEKHIQAIFKEARASRAMLLFDEADALFAARSREVNSSNDRYANMEVNLLLQEIERFPGVAILTTNSWGALDPAMMRRIQFRVTFEEPDVPQRALIWRKLCSPKLDVAADVSFEQLAVAYEFTGARIKNALLRAAYEAARRTSPVTQEILLWACANEAQAAGLAIRDPEHRDADLEAKRRRIAMHSGTETPQDQED